MSIFTLPTIEFSDLAALSLNDIGPIDILARYLESTQLYINGHVNVDIGANLYIRGSDVHLLTAPLFIENRTQNSYDATLYTYGKVVLNSFVKMRMEGFDRDNKSSTLYMDAIGLSSKALSMYVRAPEIRYTNDGISLLMDGGFGTANGSFDLYLKNTETHADLNAYTLLSISGKNQSLSSSLSLLVNNTGISRGLSLSIRGAGGWNSAVPTSDSLNLFLLRPDATNAIPMFCKSLDSQLNSYISLYTTSSNMTNNGISLVLFNGSNNLPNSYVELITKGGDVFNKNATLVIPSTYDIDTGILTLHCENHGGAPNSFISLCSLGAHLMDNGVDLVMPNTHGTINDAKHLYTHGY